MRPVCWSSEGSRTSGGVSLMCTGCGYRDCVRGKEKGRRGGYEPIMIRFGEGSLERSRTSSKV